MLGLNEIIVIALVVFVLFGAAAIPKFAKSLGQAKSEFEKGLKGGASSADSKSKSKAKSDASSKKQSR